MHESLACAEISPNASNKKKIAVMDSTLSSELNYPNNWAMKFKRAGWIYPNEVLNHFQLIQLFSSRNLATAIILFWQSQNSWGNVTFICYWHPSCWALVTWDWRFPNDSSHSRFRLHPLLSSASDMQRYTGALSITIRLLENRQSRSATSTDCKIQSSK